MLSFLAPRSMAELAAALVPDRACWLIAGGTDRLIAPVALPAEGAIVDLSRLADLDRIEVEERRLRLGAGVRAARLATDDRVARFAPVLTRAARVFGSTQIRNRATIGGNVANGSAAADLTPALLAADAVVRVWSAGLERSLPLATLLGRSPALHRGEIILGFDLPLVEGLIHGGFVKLGQRLEPAISRLTLAAAGALGALRLYAGAVGPVPRRLAAAEALLNAGDPRFAEALSAELSAANPGRDSTRYKALAARGLAADLLAQVSMPEVSP